eukprot:6180184-Pleurochrysis_carterae.AAC.3
MRPRRDFTVRGRRSACAGDLLADDALRSISRDSTASLAERAGETAAMSTSKRVLVPVGDGSEEIETVCITDTLVRAGVEVTIASVMPGQLTLKMARGLIVTANRSIDECVGEEWDAIACPGGMPGAKHLSASTALADLLKKQVAASKWTAAVCASPAIVLAAHGLLPTNATCFPAPALKEKVPGWMDEKVVVDGCIITSQGPGTSLQFALKIVEVLLGKEKAQEIASALLTTPA